MQTYFPDVDSNALARLETLLATFAESNEDLFAKWEAFSIKTGAKSPNDSELDAFQEHLEKNANQRNKRPKLRSNALLGMSRTINDHANQGSGAETAGSAVVPSVSTVRTFHNQNIGENVSSLPAANFSLNTNLSDFSSRPFNQQIADINAELDLQIEDCISRVQSARALTKQEITSARIINQNPVIIVGRLCRAAADDNDDAPTEIAETESGGWQIQAPKRLGGACTPIDLAAVHPDYKKGLFEGGIFALKGKNPKGEVFVVSEIIPLPPLPVANIKPRSSEDNANDVLRIAVACAPKNSRNLEKFLTYAGSSCHSSATVILGPIVSQLTELKRVSDVLGTHTKQRNSPFVLVPSIDDYLTTDPVFPQPPISSADFLTSLGNTVAKVSNPCTFSLDEMACTVVNVPILEDMKLPFETTCQHILRQRRLYPVYPPGSNTNVDIPKLKLAKIEGIAPNLLLLPAKNESSVAIVDDVLCVAIPPLSDQFVVLTVKRGTESVALRTSVDVLRFN